MKKIALAGLLVLAAGSAQASLLIATVDLLTAAPFLSTTGSIASSEESSAYNREVILREGPQFVVDNAVNGVEMPSAALREQLDIVRAVDTVAAEMSYIELTIALLQIEQ